MSGTFFKIMSFVVFVCSFLFAEKSHSFLINLDPADYVGSYVVAESEPVTGPVSIDLPEGEYFVSIGVDGFSFAISATGNLTSQSSTITVAGNTIKFNNTDIRIDPGEYVGFGRTYAIVGVSESTTSGVGIFTLPMGIQYAVHGLAHRLRFSFAVNVPCSVDPSQVEASGFIFTLSCVNPSEPTPQEIVAQKSAELVQLLDEHIANGKASPAVAEKFKNELNQMTLDFSNGKRRGDDGGGGCDFICFDGGGVRFGDGLKIGDLELSPFELMRIIQLMAEIAFAINGSFTFDVGIDVLIDLIDLLAELELIPANTAEDLKNVLRVVDMFNPKNLVQSISGLEEFQGMVNDLVDTGVLPSEFGEFMNREADKILADLTVQLAELVDPNLADKIREFEDEFKIKVEDLIAIGSIDFKEAKKSLSSAADIAEHMIDLDFADAIKEVGKLGKDGKRYFVLGGLRPDSMNISVRGVCFLNRASNWPKS